MLAVKLEQRSDILAAARALYRSTPNPVRTLQQLRPYICPFEDLVKWLPERGRMLDIGCGAGLFMGLAGQARPGLEAIGFDADAGAIAAAKTMGAANYPDGRVRFLHSAVGEPWPEGPFDVVSMIDVLHHIPPAVQKDVIAEAYAHVKPGGLFIYKDMADGPFYRAWWNRLHDIIIARQWIHYRRIEDVENWLRSAGAEIVERQDRHLGLYGHELLVSRKPG